MHIMLESDCYKEDELYNEKMVTSVLSYVQTVLKVSKLLQPIDLYINKFVCAMFRGFFVCKPNH